MDRIDRMELFARIVESGSFAHAARALGVARSTASEAVKLLEEETGTRLLARTTRHVSPTAEGEDFYHRARAILAELEEAYGRFRTGAPRGHLRIDASGQLTRTFLVPRVADFLTRYPDLTIAFGQSDRFVDLLREGVDCALRVGDPEDSSLKMRRLGLLPEITCASPAYLAAHGTPRDIDDLGGHQMVGFVSSRTGEVMPLEFRRDGRVEIRRIPARVTTDNSDTAAALAANGLGLIQAPRYRFTAALEAGTLVEVLPDTLPEPMPLNAIYAGNRQMSRRLDVFLDWVAGLFAAPA
ncbi:LysR family transcriptional regulator [Acuticoccus kandeliae]|uniref:LysR family transcriptional regulator n=1 Tax=Acuticoccus kandeliae TaxID=2073160 RepID=UPI000D3E198E|nr:LysR family transcriptional regulator [Acuticoccus kandeliae]